jgi:hypothetical protein
LRREALWSEWRWETFAVWPVVAGQRSWGQSDSGGAGEGGSSPDESQDGPVLPDGVGLVSVAERSTRGTGVVTSLKLHRLEPGGCGPEAVRTRLIVGVGELISGAAH